MKKMLFFLVFLFSIHSVDIVSQAKPLRIITFEYPPFMYTDSKDNASGICVEIVEEVFREMNVPITIEFFPISRCVILFENNEADGVFSTKRSKEREKNSIFPTIPIVVQDYVLFKKKIPTLTMMATLNR